MTPDLEECLNKIGLQRALQLLEPFPFQRASVLADLVFPSFVCPRDKKHRKEIIEKLETIKLHAEGLQRAMLGLDLPITQSVDFDMTDARDRDDGIPENMKILYHSLTSLIASIDHQTELSSMYHGEEVTSAPGRPIAEHADRVAKSIAEIYYLAHRKVPGAGNTDGMPNGPYGRAVEEAFIILGLNTNWRSPAEKARNSLTADASFLDDIIDPTRTYKRPSLFTL